MKLFFLLLLVCFGSAVSMAQAETSLVTEIYVAKDDGQGIAGPAVDSFSVTDLPIHCVVVLKSNAAVTVKMNFIAVDVKGVKPETRVITVNFKTDGAQNQVYFTGKPKTGNWVAGNYRVDIFVDDKLAGSKAFPITGPAIVPAAQTNFVAPKPKPRPKRVRKP